MDYDDNDFQSQNLQLAGEGSAKFPPVIRQYALPKFDFDDTLQGHARFDSLVEAEVFLGIESNDDNQWIEDYSRGSSGIGFSSCAAESCSILRRKNVWSEATSSESVEMLLKSVGQEDINLPQGVAGDSNDCDKLTKSMDPTLNDDGSSVGEMQDLPSTLLSDVSLGKLPAVEEEDTRGKLLRRDDDAESEAVRSVDGVLGEVDVDPNIVHEIVDMSPSEGNPVIDENSKQTSSSTTDMSAAMLLEDKRKDDFAALAKHVNELATCTQSGSGELSNQNIQPKMNDSKQTSSCTTDMSAAMLLEDKGKDDFAALAKQVDELATCTQSGSGELSNQNTQLQMNDLCGRNSVSSQNDKFEQVVNAGELCKEDQTPPLSASVVEERLVVDPSIVNLQPLASMTLKGDPVFDSGNREVTSEVPAETIEFDDTVLSTSVEIGSQLKGNMPEVLPTDLEGDARIEVCAGVGENIDAEVCGFQGPPIVSVGPMAYTQTIIVEEQPSFPLDVGIQISKSESSASAMEESDISKVGEIISDQIRDISCKFPGETHGMSSLRHVHKTCTPRENLQSDGHIASSSLVESTQSWEENTPCRQHDVHTEHVSVSENEDVRLSSDSVSESSKRIESSSLQESGTESEAMDARVGNNAINDDESVSVSTLGDAVKATCGTSAPSLDNENVATFRTLEGDSWPSVENLTKNQDTDPREDQLPPTLVGFTQSDRKEENAVTTPLEGSSYEKNAAEGSFPLLDTTQHVAESHPSSQAEKLDCDVAGQGLCQGVDLSPSKNLNEDDCNTEGQDILQPDINNDVSQDCGREMDVAPVSCEPTAKPCDGVIKNSDARSVPINVLLVMQSLPSLLGESLGTDQKDQENTEVTPVSAGVNCQQVNAANIECDAGENEGSFSSVAFSQSHPKSSVVESDNLTDAHKAASDSPGVIKNVGISHGSNEKEYPKGPLTETAEVLEANGRMVGNVCSGSQNAKGSGVSESARVSIFESSSLVDPPNNYSGTSGQSSSVAPVACKTSSVVDGSQSSSGLFKMDVKSGQDISLGSPQVSEVIVLHGRSRGTPERKSRRASAKGSGKESSAKGNHIKKSEKVEKSNTVSTSNSGIFHLVQSNEMQHHGHVESSGAKPFVFIGTSTSSIPDLNNSASPSPMFQQPFTDLQQVQLRAQIFVYGALIQGTAPDEAYMLSAFGGPDGGTNLWENPWRMCVDRLHGKKSHPINPETPLQSQSGSRCTEPAKQSTLQSKVISPPVSRISSKSTPTALNPMIPLSSPLWSISTPSSALQSSIVPRSPVVDYQQALTPMHPYQTPPVRNFIGHNLSWFSQAPFHNTWVAPQTTAPDTNARFSGLPMTEPVHLTPLKDSAVPQSSAIKPSGSMVHGGALGNVFTGASPLLELKKISVTTGQNSTDSKSRRRKKPTVSEDPGQMTMQAQPQLRPVSAVVTTTISTLATSPSVHPKAASENLILSASLLCPTTHLKNPGQNVRGGAVLPEETLGKVREARQLAEDAALFASEAVKHSGEVWNQLNRQKNSELVSDVEAKLASAAAAIAAAAAVAKAAAAAANVASNAAFQAKLMADEAMTLSVNEFSCQNNEISIHGSAAGAGVGKATPASILRGDDGGNFSSSIIVVAREAARKRVEAASAASKHAENMDAIVKAAELAAAAVSQAGKIVAMGDPLPLRKLVEAGPEGYWKVPQVSSELVMRSGDVNGECSDSSIKHPRGQPAKNENQASVNVKSTVPGEISVGSVETHSRLVDGFTSSEKDLREQDQNVSDPAKTIGVVPESELGARSSLNEHGKAKDLNHNGIKEGSLVEVYKDGNGLKAAWFTANVLSLKEGKAYVCYTELQPEEGSGQLKEWVALDGQGGMAPRIRISRSIATFRSEGTKKRRRAAAGDHIWSVGDKVDAWMQNSWHEGVVVEKDSKDETTYTVHFPARDEASVVKAWNLRPCLIWKDGEWFESSSLHGNEHEIVFPQEKRMKLGNLTAEVKGKDKMPTSLEDVESVKPADPSLLVLSVNEKVFNVGRTTQTEIKPNPLKTTRTGLQKGASRVIIGVPKPGKKRKFMEVSKHYVADSTQTTEANDSVKLMKYLMPQGSNSKGWKRNSKFESKEKHANDSKPMGIKSGKQPGVSDHAVITKDSESQIENASEKHNQMDGDSFGSIRGAAEGSILFSAHAPKKATSFNNKPERANKGKLAPAAGRLAKIEEDKVFSGNATKLNSNVTEPRRSNRRIQPTSRLLEGLQSSLTISKIPSVSHDKGPRTQNRNASRGNKI